MTSLKNDKYLKSKTWYHGSEEPLEGPLRSIYLTPTLSLAKIHGTVVTAFKIASGASIVDLEEIDLQGSMDSLGYTDFHKNFNADILWYKEDWLRYQQQIYVVNPKAVKVIQKDDMFKNESFYHGTTQDLKAGDEILPPSITDNVSEKGRKKNLDKVFFTKDIGSAKIYAGRAKHSLGGSPVIYEIEPMGEIEWLNQKQGTSVGMSSRARILRRVTEMKTMKNSKLQNLIEQCVREELDESGRWGDAYGRTWADGSPRQRWKDDDDSEWTPARARANAEQTRVHRIRPEMNRLLAHAYRLVNKDLDVLNANLPSQMKGSAPFATINSLFKWLLDYDEDFKAVEELISNVGGEG